VSSERFPARPLSADPTPRAEQTGARLGFALLAYMLAVALIITLLPFAFAWPRHWHVAYIVEPLDVVANIVLFVPLGFFYRFARGAERVSALHVLFAGALASGAIETAQLFEAARYASPVDVAANALGAWLGGVAAGRVASTPRVEGRLVGWLALELPLMALVYLMVPLLWIDALSSGREALRGVMAPLLGVFGAIVLGGIQRHYLGPLNAAKPAKSAAFAAGWFLAGAFPSLAWRPLGVVTNTAIVAVLTWWQGRRGLRERAANRRFEVPLLRTAAPVYAAYLVLIAIAPVHAQLGPWFASIGFSPDAVEQIEILRLLELMAAFTLAGYMLAEFRGRSVAAYRDTFPRLLAWGLALAGLVEILRGFDAAHGASLARGALLVGAVLYGAWLYFLQRAHVVRLLAGTAPTLVAARDA
jgi:VanZ family protein